MNELKKLKVVLGGNDDDDSGKEAVNISKASYYQELASQSRTETLLKTTETLLKVSESNFFNTFTLEDQEAIRQKLLVNLGIKK